MDENKFFQANAFENFVCQKQVKHPEHFLFDIVPVISIWADELFWKKKKKDNIVLFCPF